ncbi:hypothetical protein Tco_1303593 [Tanacetum coccineum]
MSLLKGRHIRTLSPAKKTKEKDERDGTTPASRDLHVKGLYLVILDNNITIAESERYPPDEYLHLYEPSQRYQVNSNGVSFIEPYEKPKPIVTKTDGSSDQNDQADENDQNDHPAQDDMMWINGNFNWSINETWKSRNHLARRLRALSG